MTAVETAQRNFGYTTIALKCNTLHIDTSFPAKDDEDIYPGMLLLVEEDSDGVWTTIKCTVDASDADGKTPVIGLAMEKREVGETIHDVYDDGENVIAVVPHKGDKVLVRVYNGEDVSTLDYLVSNGDGTVRVADSGEYYVALFQAAGDCDMTQSDEDDEIALVPAYVL